MTTDIKNTTNLTLEKPARGDKAWGPSYWRLVAIIDLWLTQLARGHTVVSGGNLTVGVTVTVDATTVAFAGQTVLLSILAQTAIPSLDISKTYLVFIDNAGDLTVTEFNNSTLYDGVDLPTDFVLLGMVFQDQGVWRAHNFPLESGRGKSLGVAPLDGDGNIDVGALPEITDAIHGNRGGGALHAAVIAGGASGFMTGADKTKLDGGHGSGLDADLLDGSHGSFYQNAGNLNAGTLPAARFTDTSHGNRGGGSLHPVVIAAGASGFQSGVDKTILDDLAAAISIFNGAIVQTVAVVVASDGAQWTLTVADADGGNDLSCYFNGTRVILDVSSPVSVNLTTGADDDPQANYIYLLESGGTVTLVASDTEYPTSVDFCPIATVFLQSAASGAIDGAFKVHAWTDHIATLLTGHLAHINEKFRNQNAGYVSGMDATLTIGVSTVFIEITAGKLYQLHKHDFPAKTMSAGPGDPIWVVNEPGSAYNRITDLDDLTQAVDTASLDGKHFSLVVWGVVSEAEADCKLYLNLPTGVYNTQAQAVENISGKSVYTMPGDFKGTAFLLAEFIVQANLGGTWILHETRDLRDLFPSTAAGQGVGVTTHSSLLGLAVLADHPGYLAMDGSRIASFLQLDLAFAGAVAEGQLNWNATDGTLEFGLPGGNVTLQVGQETLVKCVNKTGVTINDGDVVYISGASGSRPEISLADASDPAKAMPLGMATEDIINNAQGYVNVGGLVRDIDTSGIAVGAPGYLSEATPGALRATAPGGANAEVIVGYCVFSSAGSGVFLIHVNDQFSQHLLLDGTRAMTGALDMGTKAITNVGNVDGRDLSTDGTKLDGISGTNTGDEPNSTTAVRGIIELATQAEVDAGTDAVRAVTPLTLENKPGSGAGMELVASVALGASGGTITHTFAAGYDYWAIISQAVTRTDGVFVYLRMNGAAGGTAYSWRVATNGGNEFDNSDSEIQLTGITFNVGSAANEEFGPCRIDFGEMSSASLFKRVNWQCGWTTAGSAEITANGHGMWQSAAAVTSIFIGASGGSPHFDSGVLTLYRSSRT
jgi:hypothetical protein